jgi:5-methylcytosine-specific restriction endonuclease McrA
MGKRQRAWARHKRAALVAALGGKCVKCSSEEQLTFDHLYRRDWIACKVASDWRISIYYREWKNGLIQLLCAKCNSKKGPSEQLPLPINNDNEPF